MLALFINRTLRVQPHEMEIQLRQTRILFIDIKIKHLKSTKNSNRLMKKYSMTIILAPLSFQLEEIHNFPTGILFHSYGYTITIPTSFKMATTHWGQQSSSHD